MTQINVAFLGAANSGKSSLMRMLFEKSIEFHNAHLPNDDISIAKRTVDNTTINAFEPPAPRYVGESDQYNKKVLETNVNALVQNANVIVYCFDLAKAHSDDDIQTYVAYLKQTRALNPRASIILTGTKLDKMTCNEEEAQRKLEELAMSLHEQGITNISFAALSSNVAFKIGYQDHKAVNAFIQCLLQQSRALQSHVEQQDSRPAAPKLSIPARIVTHEQEPAEEAFYSPDTVAEIITTNDDDKETVDSALIDKSGLTQHDSLPLPADGTLRKTKSMPNLNSDTTDESQHGTADTDSTQSGSSVAAESDRPQDRSTDRLESGNLRAQETSSALASSYSVTSQSDFMKEYSSFIQDKELLDLAQSQLQVLTAQANREEPEKLVQSVAQMKRSASLADVLSAKTQPFYLATRARSLVSGLDETVSDNGVEFDDLSEELDSLDSEGTKQVKPAVETPEETSQTPVMPEQRNMSVTTHTAFVGSRSSLHPDDFDSITSQPPETPMMQQTAGADSQVPTITQRHEDEAREWIKTEILTRYKQKSDDSIPSSFERAENELRALIKLLPKNKQNKIEAQIKLLKTTLKTQLGNITSDSSHAFNDFVSRCTNIVEDNKSPIMKKIVKFAAAVMVTFIAAAIGFTLGFFLGGGLVTGLIAGAAAGALVCGYTSYRLFKADGEKTKQDKAAVVAKIKEFNQLTNPGKSEDDSDSTPSERSILGC